MIVSDITMQNTDIKIYIDGKNRTDDIAHCEKCARSYKIIYKSGKKYNYGRNRVNIVKLSNLELKINKRLEYFKEIAEAIGITTTFDNGKTINILSNNFKKVKDVKDDTILYNFLSGIAPIKPIKQKQNWFSFIRKKEQEKSPIFPFGFNISQKEAVKKVLKNELTVIEGPPGTGKTQTILNIIANAIMQEESVAVVSSNNAATKNIIDKLQKYDTDFIAAYLGSNDNVDEFLKNQQPLPEMNDWLIDEKERTNLYKQLDNQNKLLDEMLLKKNELAGFEQIKTEIQIERQHHIKYLESFDIDNKPKEISRIKNSKQALRTILRFDESEEAHKKTIFFHLINWLLNCLRLQIDIDKLSRKYPKAYLIALCQDKFYEFKLMTIEKCIKKHKNDLNNFNFDEKMKDYANLSNIIFKDKLAKKYSKGERTKYDAVSIQTKSEEFVEDYPVILSTTYSVRNCLAEDVKYNYVIVDEASQVDICTGVLALSCAKKAVIVGDLKQLPNVVKSDKAKITDNIFNKYKLPEPYRYKNHCLLSSITKLFPLVERILLKEHYRCHPQIIQFCNKKFYNNELIILSDIKSSRTPLLVYKTVKGNLARNNYNQRQIDMIINEIIPNENLCTTDDSLGIVTPYCNQTNALQNVFKDTSVKADTVDKFQGQENKVIILSTVDNKITEFTDNPNRLNVAISRAIEQLIVVINGNETQANTTIDELIKYIQYNNCDIKESTTYSVFDYLYKCYEDERKKYLKNCKKVSKYQSENIMYKTICDFLDKYYKNQFDIVVHFPLNLLIKNKSLMTEDEYNYASNPWTHVDFLIYNKIDKSPLMAIEVDGWQFHNNNANQQKNDILKNSIFQKYGLKLLRFSTIGSNEIAILKKHFNELIN